MSKILSQTFSVEGFQDQKSWIGKLFGPLNQFILQVYQALQNNLTVSENLYQEILTYTVANETSNFPIKLSAKFKQYPEAVTLIHCKATDATYPSAAPLLQWDFNDGTLIINSISGLTASKKYTIKLHIIYK